MEELISIIVPVYNLENYFEQCIDSILKQTYHNIEVIIVDDGSTDKSGQLCDAYAVKDKRIRIIHKDNGGLSDARNIAIPLAKGDYILFVDGDDYLDTDYVTYLYELKCKYSADIAICEFSFVSEDGVRINHPLNDGSEKIFDQKTSLFELLNTKLYSNSASGKLYRRDLLKDIHYPVGRLFEDIATTYKIFLKSHVIAFGARALYYYVQHNNTISTSIFSLKKLDSVEFVETMTDEIEKVYPDLANICKCRRIDTYVGILKQIDVYKQNKLALCMHDKIKDCRKIVFMKESTMKRKIWALTSLLNTSLYVKLLSYL